MIGIPSGWERRAAAHTAWYLDLAGEKRAAFFTKLTLKRVNEPWDTDSLDAEDLDWDEVP